MSAATPPRIGTLKRPGDELVSDRKPSTVKSPSASVQTLSPQPPKWNGVDMSSSLLSPLPDQGPHRPVTPVSSNHQSQHPPHHPDLLHASSSASLASAYAPYEADESTPRSPVPSHRGSPMVPHAAVANGQTAGWLSPSVSSAHLLSPRPSSHRRSATPDERSVTTSLRHPPLDASPSQQQQPDLLRTSQIPSGPTPSPYGGAFATYSNKAVLKLNGDLNQMAMGWSTEEWTNRRRLIQFYRAQEGNVIDATFRPISQQDFVPSSIVISCIFRDEWNECFVTSVDTIYLLEALVGVRFTVEEKNRIRRNLEGFKPMTVSKSKPDSEPFFKLIMSFPNPKPRNIEKDVKVFPWKVLANALKKIIGKYSATYSAPVDNPSVHIADERGQLHHDPRLTAPGYSTPAHPSSPHPHHSPYAHPHSQPGSPHLSTSVDHFNPVASPHLGHAPSARDLAQRYLPQPPTSPAPPQHRFGASQPNSPHIGDRGFASPQPPADARFSPPPSHRISPRSIQPRPHSGSSFDFQAILDTSQFGPGSSSASSGAPNHHGAHGPGYPGGHQEVYSSSTTHMYPSSEDYGVDHHNSHRGGFLPPPMNQSRSYSEGPRRGPNPPQHYGSPYSASTSPYHHGSVTTAEDAAGNPAPSDFHSAYPTLSQGNGAPVWDRVDSQRPSSTSSTAVPLYSTSPTSVPERRPASTDGHQHQPQRDWDTRTYPHER